jgi:hypothetical protein
MSSKIGSLFRLVLLLSLAAGSVVRAGDALSILPVKPQNGVFVTSTGLMKTVIELKDGRFRYWFKSDARSSAEPAYPLEGAYSVEGNTIKLEHGKVSQKEWTFRSVDGIVSLWRPDALKIEADGTPFKDYFPLGMANFRRCGAGAILVAAGQSGEEAWTSDRTLEISKEQELEMERTDGK